MDKDQRTLLDDENLAVLRNAAYLERVGDLLHGRNNGLPFELRQAMERRDAEEWVLRCSVVVGGYSGGSCYSDPSPFRVEDADTSFSELKKFILFFAPDLPFRLYAELESKVLKADGCQSDYYGNYEDLHISMLFLEDIVEIIHPYLRKGISPEAIKEHFEIYVWGDA